jgi:hypothetical protein
MLAAFASVSAPAAAMAKVATDSVAVSATEGGPVRLLFIHHSCGGQLLAEPGEQSGGGKDSDAPCIYRSHPNGGGLRSLLQGAGYEVHEASYGSLLGEDTDICHWRRKFAGQMDRILVCDEQDRVYEDGLTNEVVVFKSCYSSIDFTGPGEEPGDPDSTEQTLANAKAAYRALLPLFRARPDVLFVAVTAPPRAEPRPQGLMERLRAKFRRGPVSADHAHALHAWMADHREGWLKDYDLPNVAVFDYHGVLTDGRRAKWSAYASGGGSDSHPSRKGNARAAAEFVPFLDAAVAGLRAGGR